VSYKNVIFIFQITLSKLTDFNDFLCATFRGNLTSLACTFCQPRLYTVAAVPWKIQKSHFSTTLFIIIYIIYVISKENKLLPLCPPHLKEVTALPWEMQNFCIWLKVITN